MAKITTDEIRKLYHDDAVRLGKIVDGKIDSYDAWLERERKGWESIGFGPILRKWGLLKGGDDET